MCVVFTSSFFTGGGGGYMFSFCILHVVTTYLLCGCFSWFLYVVLCGLELAVVRGVPLHCRKDGQSVAKRQ